MRVVHGCFDSMRDCAVFMQCLCFWYVLWYAMVCSDWVSASRDADTHCSEQVWVVWCGYYTISTLGEGSLEWKIHAGYARKAGSKASWEVFHRLSILPYETVPMCTSVSRRSLWRRVSSFWSADCRVLVLSIKTRDEGRVERFHIQPMCVESLGFELDFRNQVVSLWCGFDMIVYREVCSEFIDYSVWNHFWKILHRFFIVNCIRGLLPCISSSWMTWTSSDSNTMSHDVLWYSIPTKGAS